MRFEDFTEANIKLCLCVCVCVGGGMSCSLADGIKLFGRTRFLRVRGRTEVTATLFSPEPLAFTLTDTPIYHYQ